MCWIYANYTADATRCKSKIILIAYSLLLRIQNYADRALKDSQDEKSCAN